MVIQTANRVNVDLSHWFSSGALRREKRSFLRNALKELTKVLEDEPALLGPKVSIILLMLFLMYMF